MVTGKAFKASIVAAVAVAAGALFLPGVPGWPNSGVAFAQDKAQAKQSLDQIVKSLRAVDTAYASGNAAEAQTRYDDALANWNKVSPALSAREARESQLLFDHLGSQLKSGAPAKTVRGTVNGLLGELQGDIREELD